MTNFDKNTDFIVGIDLGEEYSTLAYFDTKKMAPRVLDMSGGYGKVSMATALQYEKDELVFGEYAREGKTLSYFTPEELQKYIHYLIEQIKNINPRANISCLVLTGKVLLKEMNLPIPQVKFADQIQSIFTYHYYTTKIKKENILLLDFGATSLRISINKVDKVISHLGYSENPNLGTSFIDKELQKLFIKIYTDSLKLDKISLEDKRHMALFVKEIRDMILQKEKDHRLYFNFTMPPLKAEFSKEALAKFLSPFKKELIQTLNRSLKETGLEFSDIDTLCTVGGGAEMIFIKNTLEELFPDAHIVSHKSPKAVAAKGAVLMGAAQFSLIYVPLEFEKRMNLNYSIGLYGGSKSFIPIVDKNNFNPAKVYSCIILVNRKTTSPFTLDLVKKENEKLKLLKVLDIDPIDRPPQTTKLKITLRFDQETNKLKIKVKDLGFGELYLPTDFEKEYEVGAQ